MVGRSENLLVQLHSCQAHSVPLPQSACHHEPATVLTQLIHHSWKLLEFQTACNTWWIHQSLLHTAQHWINCVCNNNWWVQGWIRSASWRLLTSGVSPSALILATATAISVGVNGSNGCAAECDLNPRLTPDPAAPTSPPTHFPLCSAPPTDDSRIPVLAGSDAHSQNLRLSTSSNPAIDCCCGWWIVHYITQI
jgi:hypothetical protein